MFTNILIISTSLRPKSDSGDLADKLMNGAMEAGHKAGKNILREKDIRFYRSCLTCQHIIE